MTSTVDTPAGFVPVGPLLDELVGGVFPVGVIYPGQAPPDPDAPPAEDTVLSVFALRGAAGVAALVGDGSVSVGVGAAVGLLAGVDPLGLPAGARVDLVRGLERCKAMLDGLQVRAVAAVTAATQGLGRPGWEARFEVAAALRLAPGTGAERVQVAAVLVERLPDTLAALERGEICWRQAAVIAAAVEGLSDDQAARLEGRVLGRAGSQTVGQTRRSVERAVVAVDPGGAAERHRDAVARRGITVTGRRDGMVSWWATMPASVSGDLWVGLSTRAREQSRLRAELGLPDLGLDALRVDVLVDAVLGNGGTDPAQPLLRVTPTARPAPAGDTTAGDTTAGDTTAGDTTARDAEAGSGWRVEDVFGGEDDLGWRHAEPAQPPTSPGQAGQAGQAERGTAEPGAEAGDRLRMPRCSCGGAQTAAVVVDLPTALGLAEHPGEVPGYGPVTGAVAREMAMSRDWVRWLVDPVSGELLDVGAERYRPSDRLRRFVAARDRVCGFPGCPRPASMCDCDHVVTFAHHGRTVRVNLGPLCRSHHNAKTHGLWQLTYDPDTGDKTWTSPLGKTYTVSTDPVLT